MTFYRYRCYCNAKRGRLLRHFCLFFYYRPRDFVDRTKHIIKLAFHIFITSFSHTTQACNGDILQGHRRRGV